jgi:hypothetical protein
MRKPITPFAHGVADYATVAALVAAPTVLRLPRSAANAAYGLAAGYAGLSAMTDYPLSVRKTVSFKAHGASEAVIGAMLPALPWVLGFSEHRAARNLFFGLAALTAAVSLATDWTRTRSA